MLLLYVCKYIHISRGRKFQKKTRSCVHTICRIRRSSLSIILERIGTRTHMVRILPFWTSLFIVVVLGSTPAESQSVKTSTRIVGGAAVRNKDKFPYFAHLRVKWNDDDGIRHIITCGGSLITSTAVLVSGNMLSCLIPMLFSGHELISDPSIKSHGLKTWYRFNPRL